MASATNPPRLCSTGNPDTSADGHNGPTSANASNMIKEPGISPRQSNLISESSIVRKQFAESIGTYANRHKESYLFSGEHYASLASFLDQRFPSPKLQQKYAQPVARFKGVCVQINAEDRKKNQFIEYDAWDGHTGFQTLPPPDLQTSHLVFLRGWQSREWLRVVGAQCNADPEVFRRHLDFLDPKDFYDLPGLPSRTRHICQLRISTIIKRQVALTQQQVRKARDTDGDAVKQYQNGLRSEGIPGDSIVRRYAVHNETTSTIEQNVSLSACHKSNGGWVGVAWIDGGRRLSNGISAPWYEANNDQGNVYDPYVPVVQHRAKVPFLVPQMDLAQERVSGGSSLTNQRLENPSQSACMLPAQYGSLLDPDLMRSDAFYAFSDLFAFAASSENQFLGLVQSEVDLAIRSFRGQEQWSLESLRYSKGLLDEHAEHVEHTLSFLKTNQSANWPQATESQKAQLTSVTRKMLLDDFSHLLERAKTLSSRAMDGMHLIMNDAMLNESQKAILQAREVGRLSLLAYFFLPLSFVSSLFGMNFVEIESLGWAIGSAFIVFMIVLGISTVMCFWESIPWRILDTGISSLRL